MRKFLFFICLIPLCIQAHSLSDTITISQTTPTELREIVVEGSTQTTGVQKSTYIPMKQTKTAARDAVSLLSLMSIPQLDVNLFDKSIKTNFGQTVSIYIDYAPATEQELDGMRTEDVKKVEYYIASDDPRFGGNRYVINSSFGFRLLSMS